MRAATSHTKTVTLPVSRDRLNGRLTVSLGDLFDFCSALNLAGRPWDQPITVESYDLRATWGVSE